MAKKEGEKRDPIPSKITYMITDLALNKFVDLLIDELQQPNNGVRAKVVEDRIIISFDRELSLDEAFYLGALVGKMEQRMLLGVPGVQPSPMPKNSLKG